MEPLQTDEKKLILKSPLFRGISEAELSGVLEGLSAQRRTFRREAPVFLWGETPGLLGIVLKGSVHILQEDFWGNSTILAQIRPGDLFGEAFALAEAPLTVTARAADASEILLIQGERLLRGKPESGPGFLPSVLVQNMLRVLAQKNVFLTERIGHIAQRSTREKVLSYLSEQAVKTGKSCFQIPLNRQEMADYLAVDRSALSAVLSGLQSEGVLRFRKNDFTLFSEKSLKVKEKIGKK